MGKWPCRVPVIIVSTTQTKIKSWNSVEAQLNFSWASTNLGVKVETQQLNTNVTLRSTQFQLLKWSWICIMSWKRVESEILAYLLKHYSWNGSWNWELCVLMSWKQVESENFTHLLKHYSWNQSWNWELCVLVSWTELKLSTLCFSELKESWIWKLSIFIEAFIVETELKLSNIGWP